MLLSTYHDIMLSERHGKLQDFKSLLQMKFPTVSLGFSVTYSFRPYHGPGVDPAPSEDEYQERFLGVKAAGAWGWQPHHLHVPNVMKSGSLNLLEPSGAHRTCDGTALPFYYKWKHIWKESPNLWKPQIHLQTLWKIKVEFKKFRCIGGVAPL